MHVIQVRLNKKNSIPLKKKKKENEHYGRELFVSDKSRNKHIIIIAVKTAAEALLTNKQD